jgi:hypothetical protein
MSYCLGRGAAVSYRAIFNEFVYLQVCKDIITNFAEEKTLNKVSISAQKNSDRCYKNIDSVIYSFGQ